MSVIWNSISLRNLPKFLSNFDFFHSETDVCRQKSDPGPCSAFIKRYTFNASTGQCEIFYYGGCEGNANNFENLEDCEQRCKNSGEIGKNSNLECHSLRLAFHRFYLHEV